MKRLIVRVVVLAVLVVLGLIAIAQAQRSSDRTAEPGMAAVAKAEPVLAPVAEPASLQPVGTSPQSTRTSEPAREPANPFVQAAPASRVERPVEEIRAIARRDKASVVPVAATVPIGEEAVGASRPAQGVNNETSLGNGVQLAAVPQQIREPGVGDGRVASTAKAENTTVASGPSALGSRYANASASTGVAGGRYGSVPSQAPEAVRREGAGTRDTGVREEPAPMRLDPVAAAGPRQLNATAAAPLEGRAANDAVEGHGQPGKKQLEGQQVPQLTIQKFAPEGVQVNKPATFRVTVANSGQVVAHGVEVRDLVPKGSQLIATKPRASRGANGELVWEVGTIKPGDEIIVEMQIMPVVEGEIGSVATVRFNADASARVVATRPQLTITTTASKTVMINEPITLNIAVSNPGTGVATGVVLNEHVPPGLQFAAGTDPKCEIGTLKPGETQRLQLTLTAVRAGAVTNVLTAEGDGALKAEDRVDLQVVAPQLEIGMEGPKRRYLEREATYVFSVSNPGTAAAKQIQLVAHLPHGLKFVSANNYGHYEAATQTVHWVMEELPPREADKVELVTLPIEAGDQKLRLEGRADRGLTAQREQPIRIEGIAAVLFEVASVNNPIEVGGESVYEIRVVNQGSKAASNVRITAILPPGMRAVAAEGPTRHVADAGRIQFESLARLAPKADTTYRVRVQGLQPGDLRVRVQLQTDEMQEPVTKEECTRVYKDE
jgi:uncharacterized repeat protein (TIGR01451 family)